MLWTTGIHGAKWSIPGISDSDMQTLLRNKFETEGLGKFTPRNAAKYWNDIFKKSYAKRYTMYAATLTDGDYPDPAYLIKHIMTRTDEEAAETIIGDLRELGQPVNAVKVFFWMYYWWELKWAEYYGPLPEEFKGRVD